MDFNQVNFQMPRLIDATPLIVVLILLPAWLIYTVFKYTSLKKEEKILLIPICILAPALLSLLWPLILKFSGLIGITGPDGEKVSYNAVATGIFGEASEYVWVSITSLAVYLFYRSFKKKKLKVS